MFSKIVLFVGTFFFLIFAIVVGVRAESYLSSIPSATNDFELVAFCNLCNRRIYRIRPERNTNQHSNLLEENNLVISTELCVEKSREMRKSRSRRQKNTRRSWSQKKQKRVRGEKKWKRGVMVSSVLCLPPALSLDLPNLRGARINIDNSDADLITRG